MSSSVESLKGMEIGSVLLQSRRAVAHGWPLLAALVLFTVAVRAGWLLVGLGLLVAMTLVTWRLVVTFDRSGLGPIGILVVALFARAIVIPVPTAYSDDVWRYLWDGRVVASGWNPYLLAPEAAELAPLRDGLWERVAHREVPTVYPPLALGLFSIAASTNRPLVTWKLLLLLFDLGLCALLVVLVRRRNLPLRRVLWYAWHPLPVFEVVGQGHLDAIAVAFCAGALALLLARPRAWASAALATSAGILAKLGPLAALPLWGRASSRSWAYRICTSVVVIAVLLPFLWSVGGLAPGWRIYAASWEWNGPLYEPLWRLLDGARIEAAIKPTLGRLEAWSGHHRALEWLYPLVYPQLLAKAMLALCAGGVVLGTLRERDLLRGTRRLFGGLLLCSATVYPWYALWVLPWAAVTGSRAWLLLGSTLFLTYLPQLVSGVELVPWVFLFVWAPFWWLQWRGRRGVEEGGP